MGWSVLDDYAKAKGLRVGAPSPGQTLGGTHANGSNHYKGLARDYGRESDAAGIERLFAPLAAGKNPPIIELYGIGGTSLKDGSALSPEPAGHAGDHTHVAIRAGVTLADLMSGGSNDQSFLSSLNPLSQLRDAAGNLIPDVPGFSLPGLDSLGKIAAVFTSFAGFMVARGHFLLLVGAGILLCIAGFILLSRDLALSSVMPTPKIAK